MIDEAHELRKMQVVMIAILKNHLLDNPHKKIIVTSATLEANLFMSYFEELSTCVIEAKTPTYSVQVQYNMFPDLENDIAENTLAHLKEILEHITKNHVTSRPMPNILVFLPSIPIIKRVLEKKSEDDDFRRIQQKTDYRFEEFHGALKPEEKNMVISPTDDFSRIVRIILATNIAETAVTINNIMYVLDSGKEREYYQDEITTLSTMRTESISKSSAIQRQGRAGRVCNGFCYKMYTEKDYEEFQDSKKPEIIRMDISDVVLLNVELRDYFKISDLLFYKQIEDKAKAVAMMLKAKDCLQDDLDQGVSILSPKGKFTIEIDLEPSTAMFLYECARMKNAHYGCMAALVLEKPVGYFKNNETLSKVLKLAIGIEKNSSKYLGDLAPIIFLLEKYETLTVMEKKKYETDYQVTPFDMRRMLGDLRKITR